MPRPPPEDLPDPGIEPASLMSLVLADGFFTTSAVWEAPGGAWATVYSLCLDKNGVQEGIGRDMKQKGD